MIEKLVNSKTRLKILELFLSHIDDRYYLRELERLLNESLSPLRRQLLKLTSIGILMVEEEANLKYYRLNKDFEGLEELRELVLGKEIASKAIFDGQLAMTHGGGGCGSSPRNDIYVGEGLKPSPTVPRQFRYDLAFLSFISIFVLITAMFVVYANNKNIKQVAKFIATESTSEVAVRRLPKSDTGNGEMMSKKWKIIPGNIPVLSSEETGEEKNSKEL